MSIVTLQFGQCGNQLGHALFDTLHADILDGDCRRPAPADEAYAYHSREHFFRVGDAAGGGCDLRARAVLCDTEEKVVAMVTQAATKSGGWSYADGGSLCMKRGSGNNWAQGHRSHGPACWQRLLELTRRQAEACDRLDGLLALLSLAGGTGSGLGTFACEQLRDHFPEAPLVSGLVWPHGRGEVSVQSYNCVLTAAHLAAASDALLLFENEALQAVCERRLGLPRVNVGHLNALISHQLASCLQPTGDTWQRSAPLSSLVSGLCPHPDLRLLQLRSIPYAAERVKEFNSFTWPGLLRHLRQMLVADACMEEGVNWSLKLSDSKQRCVANRLFLRGVGRAPEAEVASFQQDGLYAAWVPSGDRFRAFSTERPCCRYEKSCAVVSNCSSSVNTLDRTVAKAWRMFASKAFLHQYERFGLEEASFLDSFAAAEQTIANYRQL